MLLSCTTSKMVCLLKAKQQTLLLPNQTARKTLQLRLAATPLMHPMRLSVKKHEKIPVWSFNAFKCSAHVTQLL